MPIFRLLSGIFFLSLTSLWGRFLPQTNVYVNTFYGYLVVTFCVFVWAIVTGNLSLLDIRRDKLNFLLLSLSQLGSIVFFFEALRRIDFATTGLLLYTAPFWVVLVYLVSGAEKISPRTLRSLAIGFVGLCLVIGPRAFAIPGTMDRGAVIVGLISALLAGISYGLMFVSGQISARASDMAAVLFWVHIIGAVVLLPVAISAPIHMDKNYLLFYLGLGSTWIGGYYFLYSALRVVKAQHASIVSLIEPFLLALWGFIFFGERIGALTLVGGMILLWNVYLINRERDAGA